MSPTTPSREVLSTEVAELRARLADAEEMLRAIRAGEVDALVVEGDAGPRLFTLQGLDAEQNRLRGEMLAQVSDAVIAVDLDDRVTFLNAAAERQYGVRASDVLGWKTSDVYTPLWPASATDAGVRTALDERGEWRGELIHRTRDAREVFVETTVAVLTGSDGTKAGVISAIRDVSARRAAEEAHRTSEAFNRSLMEGSTDCLKVLDVDGRLVHMNTPGLCVMEIDDFGPLCGQNWSAMWPAEARQDIERSVATARSGGSYAFQAFCPTVKGTPRWWDVVVNPVRDAATGQVVRLLAVSRDITSRKVVDEQVTRLAAIVESSHDALFSENLDGIITSWNRGAEQIFGYRADEIVGTSILRLIPEALQADEHERQRALVAGERGGTFEATRQAKDGRQFPASITISPLKDAAGTVIGSSRVVRDVSERQRAEEAVRAGEARVRRIVERSPAGILETDADGRMVLVNARWCEMLGYSEAELLQMRMTDVTLPSSLDATVEAVARLAQGGPDFQIAKSYRRKDGTTLPAQSNVTALRDAGGRYQGLLAVVLDLRERLEAEQRLREGEMQLRQAMDAAHAGSWTVTPSTGAFTASARALELYGVPPGTPMNHARALACVHADDRAAVEQALRRTTETGEPFRLHLRVPQVDGSVRWTSSQAERWGDGGQTRIVGLVQDITEQRRATEREQETARQKDEFIAVLAHELRNPLAPIRTAVAVLRASGPPDRTLIRCRDIIDRQVTQMARLLDDLLDVSRLSRGLFTLHRRLVRLSDIVADAVETARPSIEHRAHTLVIEPSDPAVVLDADPVRLTQVLVNLLNNAAKYTDPGGRITVTTCVEGEQLVMRVRDTGIGLEPAMLERIFDLFTQVDDVRHRSDGGLGIGLRLTRHLVEMHGGTIAAESAGLGQGMTFTVMLPLHAGAEPHVEAAQSEPTALPVSAARRVLIIDDNVDAADTLTLLLETVGCDTRTVYDGETALREAATFHPELVLLDLGLPGLDGAAVCRRLREETWGATVVIAAVTGWGQEEDRRRTKIAGFDVHLVKPVDPQQVLALVRDLPSDRLM